MKKLVPLFLSLAVLAQAAETMIQPTRIIDAHTAGVLPKASYDLQIRLYGSGDQNVTGSGLCAGMAVGITDRLNIGISYGGDGIIGRKPPRWNPYPGAFVKYRILEENFVWPALALGYDHQGFGGIDSSYNGFVDKSQGFFVAASKNYLMLSSINLGFHGAINFSLEENNKVHWPNGYIGTDIGINNELAASVEYDLGLNSHDIDSKDGYGNPFKGYLNLGARWAFSSSFYIEFLAKDILENKFYRTHDNPQVPEEFTDHRLGWSRELKFVYLSHF